jgi:hypothetical protein
VHRLCGAAAVAGCEDFATVYQRSHEQFDGGGDAIALLPQVSDASQVVHDAPVNPSQRRRLSYRFFCH